jgi:hypothetical protein
MPDYCHEEQYNTLRKIREKFTEGCRQVLLCAQMQSGKTGIFLSLALTMLADELVNRVIIICGSNETELHKQLRKSITELVSRFGNPELAEKIEAYKSTGLDSAPAVEANTLVIWDESHFAQSITNRPFKYLQKSGLSVGGTGTSDARWAALNSYFLSVSATPFAEFSDSNNAEYMASIRRQIVWHTPSPMYRGVAYYHGNECIKSSYTISDSTAARFTDLLTSFHGVNKYALVRSRDLSLVRACCVTAGVAYKEYTSKVKDLRDMDSLAKEPATFTVIGLKGMCRMGKVVPKKFIGFVFEESKTSKTDCILQSFLGRMCGHDCETDPYPEIPARIYVPSCFLKINKKTKLSELERYIRFTEGEIIMPTKASCLGAVGVITNRYPLEARCIDLPSLHAEERSHVDEETKNALIAAAIHYVEANPYSEEEQQAFALDVLHRADAKAFIECPVFTSYSSDLQRSIKDAVRTNEKFHDDWKDNRRTKKTGDELLLKYFKFYRAEEKFYMTGFTDVTSERHMGESHAHIVVTSGKEVWNPSTETIVPQTLTIIRSLADIQVLLRLPADSQRTVFLQKSLYSHNELGPLLAYIKANAGKGKGGKNWPKTEDADDRKNFDRVVLPPGVVLRIVTTTTVTTETVVRVDLLHDGAKVCETETISSTATKKKIAKHIIHIE